MLIVKKSRLNLLNVETDADISTHLYEWALNTHSLIQVGIRFKIPFQK